MSSCYIQYHLPSDYFFVDYKVWIQNISFLYVSDTWLVINITLERGSVDVFQCLHIFFLQTDIINK